MKLNVLALAGTLGAFALLPACADNYGYEPYGAYAGVDYDGYYDGYYGPFYGGYWGPSGYFYYSDRSGHRFHRDGAHHFRRDARPGYNPIHGHAPDAGDHHRQH